MIRLIVVLLFSLYPFLIFAADFRDFVVAKINNKAITDSEINDRLRFVTLTSKINIKDEEEKRILRQQVIEKMIDEELIRQEAKGLKIEVGEKELKEGIDLVAPHYQKTPDQLIKFLKHNNLSFEGYSNQVEAEILWSKIIIDSLRSRVKVSDAELNEFLEQHKLSNDVRKFFLAEILILHSDNAEKFSEKLVDELRRGADFKTISEQFSSSIAQEIGWVSQRDVDQKIYESISALRNGEYSNPIKLSDGYHIFKLIDTKNEKTSVAEKDLAAAKNIIFSRKLQTLAKGHLMDLRKRAFIEIKG